MKSIKCGLLFVLLCCIPTCYAITVQDVQMLDKNSFFGGWSQFLDQVLEAKQESISDENDAIYKEFIQQGEKLNIPKVTGNKNSISGMKKQMKFIKKRIVNEKKFFDEWPQFCETIANAQQYPISFENEELYKTFVRQGKSLGVKKSFLEEMQKKMDEIREKLRATVVPVAEPVQEPVVEEESTKENATDKENAADKEDATDKKNITEQPNTEAPTQEA